MVDGFVGALRERVRQARAALAAAHANEDPYAAAVAADELDDAVRVARGHGVDVGPEDGAEAGAAEDAGGMGAGAVDAGPEARGEE